MDQSQLNVAFLVTLLAAALVLGIVAERIRIPYTVALLVGSTPLYFPNLAWKFGPAALVIFLPALIFEAAWNLDHAALRRRRLAIFFLAVPGVVFTAAVVGFGLSLSGQLPLGQALLLGVILAATDPVAVIATFRRLAIPLDLATIVEGESLFNDGTAVVLYGVIVTALTAGGHFSVRGAGAAVAVAVAGSLGGMLVGLAVAFAVARAMRLATEPLLQIVGTVVAAYGAYLAADVLHLSGIFAAIVAGISLRAFERISLSDIAGVEIDRFWGVLAFLANSLLFLLVGLRIEMPRIWHEPWLALSTLGLVVVARIALTYGALPLLGMAGPRKGWQHVIALAGIRGALSLALALGLPQELPLRAQIIDAVFAVVFVTLTAQGLAIGPLLARMRLNAGHSP